MTDSLQHNAPLSVWDVQLLVQDPVSSFPSTRFRRVEATTKTRAGTTARREFEKNCAPIYVKRIISIEEAQ